MSVFPLFYDGMPPRLTFWKPRLALRSLQIIQDGSQATKDDLRPPRMDHRLPKLAFKSFKLSLCFHGLALKTPRMAYESLRLAFRAPKESILK